MKKNICDVSSRTYSGRQFQIVENRKKNSYHQNFCFMWSTRTRTDTHKDTGRLRLEIQNEND